MKILSDKYYKTLKSLSVKISDLTAEELKTCIEYIARFQNLKELNLEFGSLKVTEPIDDYLSLIGRKCSKLLNFYLNINSLVPISHRFFALFSPIQSLKNSDHIFTAQYSIVGKYRMFQTLQTTHSYRYLL